MTEEELVSTAEEILPDHAAANFSNGEWKRLIALARIGLAAEKLSQYAEHDSDCVLSKWSAGRPTDDGGYEMKFAGVWYKARPVDESPPCECGLAEILSALPKPGGE